jgi:hypothetical protein
MARLYWQTNTPSPDHYNPYANDVLKPLSPATPVEELRWKAEQWRKHASQAGNDDFLDCMQRAAAELDAEADKLEQGKPQQPQLFAFG